MAPTPAWEASPYPQSAPAAPPAFAPADQRVPAPPSKRRRWWLLGAAIVLVLVVAAVVWLVARPDGSGRPASIITSTDISVADIAVGDCLEPMPGPATLSTITVVPCSQFHSAQIVGKITIAQADTYPGGEQLSAAVHTDCAGLWDETVPKVEQLANTPVQAGTTVIYPSADSWKAGDRAGWCLVYGIDGDFTGTLLS